MASPSWDDVKVGDKVTLVYSGTVARVGEWKGVPEIIFDRGDDTYLHLSPLDFTLKSVEKPVREFKPGDVVQWVGDEQEVYTIGDGRYFCHQDREWFDFAGGFKSFTAPEFRLVG